MIFCIVTFRVMCMSYRRMCMCGHCISLCHFSGLWNEEFAGFVMLIFVGLSMLSFLLHRVSSFNLIVSTDGISLNTPIKDPAASFEVASYLQPRECAANGQFFVILTSMQCCMVHADVTFHQPVDVLDQSNVASFGIRVEYPYILLSGLVHSNEHRLFVFAVT